MATKPCWVIQKLERTHVVELFDCGHEVLNRYIARFALVNQSSGSAQTYVAIIDEKLIGYYSLAVGAVAHAEAPTRERSGLVMIVPRRLRSPCPLNPRP